MLGKDSTDQPAMIQILLASCLLTSLVMGFPSAELSKEDIKSEAKSGEKAEKTPVEELSILGNNKWPAGGTTKDKPEGEMAKKFDELSKQPSELLSTSILPSFIRRRRSSKGLLTPDYLNSMIMRRGGKIRTKRDPTFKKKKKKGGGGGGGCGCCCCCG